MVRRLSPIDHLGIVIVIRGLAAVALLLTTLATSWLVTASADWPAKLTNNVVGCRCVPIRPSPLGLGVASAMARDTVSGSNTLCPDTKMCFYNEGSNMLLR